MATELTIWDKLKAPFPAGTVGKLPKPTISNDEWKKLPKSKCTTCNGYHATTNTIHLDYVGHAAVTDRLNTVDPTWAWEPVALDERGLPQYDNAGGLWIKLNIGGVTRLGYGDGPNPKERIGDALRNAAMRFGVALDLWSKDELESQIDHPELKNEKPPEKPAEPAKAAPGLIHPALMTELRQALIAAEITGDNATTYVKTVLGYPAPKTNEDAQHLIDGLKKLVNEAVNEDIPE